MWVKSRKLERDSWDYTNRDSRKGIEEGVEQCEKRNTGLMHWTKEGKEMNVKFQERIGQNEICMKPPYENLCKLIRK